MKNNVVNRLPILFGYHASNLGNSHVPLSLCRNWQAEGRAVCLTVPSRDAHLSFPWLHSATGGLKKRLVYRFVRKDQPRRLAESLFAKTSAGMPIVYLWAGLSLDIFKKCKAHGSRIVIERINCHQATARNILNKAYARQRLVFHNKISDERIAEENEKLSLADAIFCPSPMVRQSMLENDVPQEKLLNVSYGWAPERFPNLLHESRSLRPVFLFVGSLCVRKGVPFLLEAWRRADINGELILCGGMDSEIEENFSSLLAGKNIRYLPYTKDIGSLYRQADVFVFPTLEEGGPMVTYEAMAHGVVPLVSKMGAGAIVENGANGVVLPENNVAAWAQAMTEMAQNRALRRRISEKARLRAQQFTWSHAAEKRAQLLEKKFPFLWAD